MRLVERHTVLLSKTDVLVLAQQVFLLRVDVGVVEKDGVVDAGYRDRFHHFAGTRAIISLPRGGRGDSLAVAGWLDAGLAMWVDARHAEGA